MRKHLIPSQPPIASRLQLPPGPWATVLDGLCARFPAIPRAVWIERMQRGRVLDAEGRPVAQDAPYRAGRELRYFREVAREPEIPFDEIVVYEDAHLLVADKPHFLPVTPGGEYVEQCLLRRLMRRPGGESLVPLHRIDRDTAGLVLFSREPGSRAAYQALFRERQIHKRYLALAPPLPDLAFPLVRRSRLEPGEPFFRMQEVAGEPNAETRVDVLHRGSGLWRYALEPVTGRKHQLRVHMAALGAPLHHDRYYPALAPQAPDDWDRPLSLLAQALSFEDPVSGLARRFESLRRLESPPADAAV
ncbi:MAG: pseudouridine synthase [Arenimonas sp.]|nr:pseudouridine synthase [Arenimonas sp.]